MPAQRSRAAGWRRCLEQIRDRRGSIELAVRPVDDDHGGDLLLRARVLAVEEEEIRVETPVTLGTPVMFAPGLDLVAIIAIGQNRWMFHTCCLGFEAQRPGMRPTLRLRVPSRVERCQRRRDYRLDTTTLCLPEVEIWPLLDLTSTVAAERLTAAEFQRELDGIESGDVPGLGTDMMPQLGPGLHGRLINLGGGGLGLSVDENDGGVVTRYASWWLRFSLDPTVRTPVCVAARMAHRHLRSDRTVYCGLCFDFAANPPHKQVVGAQLRRAIAGLQRRQMDLRKAS